MKRSEVKGKVKKALKEHVPDDQLESVLDLILAQFDRYTVEQYERIIKVAEDIDIEAPVDLKKIKGALRSCIDHHGDITIEKVGSAAKRIYGELIKNQNTL